MWTSPCSSQMEKRKLREGGACSASHGSCVTARPLWPCPPRSPLHVTDERGLRVLEESELRNNLSRDVSSASRCRKPFIFINWASGFIWQPREGKVTGVLYSSQICRNKITFLSRTRFLFCFEANLVLERKWVWSGVELYKFLRIWWDVDFKPAFYYLGHAPVWMS